MNAAPETRARHEGEKHALLHMASLSDIDESGAVVMTAAKGATLQDSTGREYFDATAGLANVNVGYGRPELVQAASDTMGRLSFASNFFGRTTTEALDLSRKLFEITPAGIDRFFFTVGGSDAMDSAVKLLRHANILAGKPEKMTVIARNDSYHGMTLGSTAITGQKVLRERVGPLMPGVVHVNQPSSSGGADAALELEEMIRALGPETVAAFIGEPIALPPGLAIPADDYWPAVSAVCKRYDVRLIVDEVVTGFGRTGRMFASEHWDLEPDIMTMSKGITSGYFPLGAVGISDQLYEQLLTSDTILPHGFTAGGHPVACAVALANIHVLENDDLVGNAERMGSYIAEKLIELQVNHGSVHSVRGLGLLAGFDVDGAILSPSAPAQAGARLASLLLADGVILRPYGNAIVVAPPLTVSATDVDNLFESLDAAVGALEKAADSA